MLFDRGISGSMTRPQILSPFRGMYILRDLCVKLPGRRGVCMQNSKPPLCRRRRLPSFDFFARAQQDLLVSIYIPQERKRERENRETLQTSASHANSNLLYIISHLLIISNKRCALFHNYHNWEKKNYLKKNIYILYL